MSSWEDAMWAASDYAAQSKLRYRVFGIKVGGGWSYYVTTARRPRQPFRTGY